MRCKLKNRYASEEGYSLIETSVALGLFVTALVPLCALLVTLLSSQRPRQEIEAQLMAQQVMEETVAGNDFAPLDTLFVRNRWRVRKSIRQEGALVVIRVRVTRAGREAPASEFTTIRLNR